MKSWEDGQYNILNMSVEETFGLGILQEGQAIAVAKNVNIQMNEFVMTAPYQVSSSLAATSFDTRAGRPETRRLGVAINAQRSPVGGGQLHRRLRCWLQPGHRLRWRCGAAHSQDFYGAVFYWMDFLTGRWIL